MEEITPDIEQWLLQDTQVVSKWSLLARHLDLLDDDCLLAGGRRRRRRRDWRERDNLEMILRSWKKKSPGSYNILTLKSILLAEGLYDMWMWINIITQGSTRPCSVLSYRASSPTPSSPWSRYLYSPSSPPPPCTWSDYGHSLSSGGSRPASQLSDYRANHSTHYSPTSSSNSSLLYRPDLIKLSSPRCWIRQVDEGRARHVSTESAGCGSSVLSDTWDSLEIIEDKIVDFSGDEELEEKTKHAVISDACRAMTGDQSSPLYSKNISHCQPSNGKHGAAERLYRKTDKHVINRVNKMNEDLKINTENSEMVTKTKSKKASENKMKKVKFEKDENSYEQQFDCILGMIQQAVEDLNV